uniref:Major facilitator superfamily (MFS) profile domain-containing protein n=1 Tax=Globisporangium ultimum (strain ATCC 200006 / CBS 805.95 / DAOM BR144) TaxID=431595 RepID=K3WZA8_GLOUD
MMQEHDEPLSTRKRLPRGLSHETMSPAHSPRGGATTALNTQESSSSVTGASADGRRQDHEKQSEVDLPRLEKKNMGITASLPSKGNAEKTSDDGGDYEAERTHSSSFGGDESNAGDEDERLSKFQQLRLWIRRVRQTFGMSFLVLVSAVYAVQGFNSFSALAVNYFFKDNLKLQPAESQTLMTLMMFPWGIKPLYGIISDSLPFFGYHRKSYMILFSSLGCLACLALSIPDGISTPLGAVCVLVINSLSAAVIDVVIDARVVEMSRLDPKYGANDLQSVSWMSMSMGGVLGSFLSGPATHQLGVRGVFFFAATGPSVILMFSLFMKEPKSTTGSKNFLSSAKRQFRQLKGAITTPVIWKCALWVFLSGAVSPGYSQIFFFFSTDVLKFTPEFLGTVSAFGFVFLLIGTLIYNAFFKDVSFRRIFLIAQLSLALVSMLDVILVTRANLNMGIPDKAFVLGDAVIADVISRLKTMPVLVLCAKLCPKGVEGTLFALLMSISNFSYSVSEFWGAFICHSLGISKGAYDKLWLAIVFRSILKITPILFLFLIPATDPQDVVDKLNFDGETQNDGHVEELSPGNGTVREDHTVNGSPMESPMPKRRGPDAVV